jgi:hypothetical protein
VEMLEQARHERDQAVNSSKLSLATIEELETKVVVFAQQSRRELQSALADVSTL